MNRNYLEESVFENRNKSYGAYAIRGEYSDNMSKGMFYSFALVLAIFMSGYYFSPEQKDIIEEIFLPNTETKEVVETAKIIPPRPIEVQPAAATPITERQVAFTANVSVVDDKKTIVDANIPTVDNLKNAVISNVDHNGIESGSGNALGPTNATPTNGNGTSPTEIPAPPKATSPVPYASIMPAFPGGPDALYKYLMENIKYPAMARESGIEGTVVLQFVVSNTGNISDIKLMRGIGGGCDEEAMRVVKKMPVWKPGNHNNVNVAVRMTIPVKYKLN